MRFRDPAWQLLLSYDGTVSATPIRAGSGGAREDSAPKLWKQLRSERNALRGNAFADGVGIPLRWSL